MRYQIIDGMVSLQGETILNHVDFSIRGKEKIAIVGKNGAGKTTLLRLIAGELSLDRDDRRKGPGIFLARNTSVGMLHQEHLSEKTGTLEEYIKACCPVKDRYAKERYDFELEYDKLFTGFGFDREEKKKPLHEFSGGEQTKIGMIHLLLKKPDILLLDEPTNHLDASSVEWLEEYVRQYEGAVVMVSHDRFFLDSTAQVIYELSDGTLTRYAGNYSEYRSQREKKRQIQRKKYEAYQQEQQRLRELIERFKHKPRKASMARAKKKQMERMEKIVLPPREDVHFFAEDIVPKHPGNKIVLEAEKLAVGYESPLQVLDFRLRRGQKIGIIGENGTGKSTFLKTLAGRIPPLSGKLRWGEHIQMEYFEQNTAEFHSEKRVLEYYHEKHPEENLSDIKKTLAQYLFRGEEVAKKISDLSGGEKSRLVLGEILESRPNLLLLDEPTNHMDIPAKETLESAFCAYGGTMLFVTHDRYFLKEVADALLIFDKDKVTYYPFGYEHYIEKEKKKRRYGEKDVREEENRKLVEALFAVPEKTRMQGARFNTEQSYTDWQLTLAAEQMRQAACALEQMLKRREELFLKRTWLEEYERWKAEYGEKNSLYEEACLAWYEKWLEYQEAFSSYEGWEEEDELEENHWS